MFVCWFVAVQACIFYHLFVLHFSVNVQWHVQLELLHVCNQHESQVLMMMCFGIQFLWHRCLMKMGAPIFWAMWLTKKLISVTLIACLFDQSEILMFMNFYALTPAKHGQLTKVVASNEPRSTTKETMTSWSELERRNVNLFLIFSNIAEQFWSVLEKQNS